jgi:5-methylcytosine-specific restriction enzyme subunit McrC
MAGLEPAEGEEPFFSFLIDMNRLFERYIAQLLARDLPMVGLEVDLQPRLPLDQAGQVPIRPDIVIRQAGRPILVVDTKYKRLAEGQVEQPDLFQVLAYCRALLIDQAMLIYPAAGATERTIRVRDGASVVEMVFFTLDGSLAELQAEEGRLVAEVTIRQADQPR